MDFAPDLDEFGFCPFAMASGQPCILCGGTRAVGALLRGDLAAAWNFNASVLVLGTCALVWAAVTTVRHGPSAVRSRVHALVAPPVDRRRANVRVALFFAVWWAWNLARW